MCLHVYLEAHKNTKEKFGDLNYTKDISYHKITIKVSSGYYIRMIAYYIYRDLGICSHVMNINRIDT